MAISGTGLMAMVIMVHNVWYQYKGTLVLSGKGWRYGERTADHQREWYYLDEDGRMATEPVVLTLQKDGALQYPKLTE